MKSFCQSFCTIRSDVIAHQIKLLQCCILLSWQAKWLVNKMQNTQEVTTNVFWHSYTSQTAFWPLDKQIKSIISVYLPGGYFITRAHHFENEWVCGGGGGGVISVWIFHRGENSSVHGTSDWKARCNTDTGSSPRCSKGFFSQSQLQCRLSYGVHTAPVCINICVHVKNP